MLLLRYMKEGEGTSVAAQVHEGEEGEGYQCCCSGT